MIGPILLFSPCIDSSKCPLGVLHNKPNNVNVRDGLALLFLTRFYLGIISALSSDKVFGWIFDVL